jgi:hypothetical protein
MNVLDNLGFNLSFFINSFINNNECACILKKRDISNRQSGSFDFRVARSRKLKKAKFVNPV